MSVGYRMEGNTVTGGDEVQDEEPAYVDHAGRL